MKIIFVTQNEAPFRMKWMDELAKYAEVIVFHINEYAVGVNPKYISYKPIRAISKDISKTLFGRKFFDTGKILKENYDILILDGYGFLAQQKLIFDLKIRHRSFIMSIDGGFVDDRESFWKRKIKAYFISAPSAYLSTCDAADEFIHHYSKRDIKIFRHFFSSILLEQITEPISEKDKQNLRKKLGLNDKFTLICVGRFIYIKGFDVLIEALKYLDIDLQVLFVGNSDIELYEKHINESNREKLNFIDFCDADLLSEYYKASDVFVLPTRSDVWGLVIGEAMAHGLPVISTNKCLAAVAMIENNTNGYIVQTDDPKALADVITQVWENPSKRSIMAKNNLQTMRKYSIEEATKKDIYNLEKFWSEYNDR